MVIRVKLPNGQYGNFPDDMPHDQIETVLRKQFPVENPYDLAPLKSPSEWYANAPKKGIASIPSDIGESLSNMGGNLSESLSNLLPELFESGAQVATNPGRALKNIGAGLGDVLTGSFNAPYNVAQYLKGKDIPYFNKAADYVPHIPDLGMNKRLELEESQPGDALLRMAASFAPFSKIGAINNGARELAKKGLSGGLYGVTQNQNPIETAILGPITEGVFKAGSIAANKIPSAVERVKNVRDYGKLQEYIEKLKTNESLLNEPVNNLESELIQSKKEAHNKFGKTTPEALTYGAEMAARKIDDLHSELNELTQEKSKLGIPEHLTPEKIKADIISPSEQAINESKQSIDRYLNKNGEHATDISKQLHSRSQSIENYWKSSYGQLKNDLKESEFHMADLPTYELDVASIIENIKHGKNSNMKDIFPIMNSEIHGLMDKAPTPKDITADDFLTKYQSFRDARYDLLQRAKNERDSVSRRALFKAYEESKPLEASIKNTLEEGLGDYRPEFERINEGYSRQIYPLRENPLIQKAKEGTPIDNAMKQARGFDEGSELVRELIKQDPELSRNVLGQEYANKHHELLNPDATSAQYIYENPELVDLLKIHEEAKSTHEKALDLHKNSEQYKKFGETESKIKSKISKLDKNINSFKEHAEKINRHESNLEQQKKLNLSEKIKIENEKKIIQDKIKRAEKDKGYLTGKLSKLIKYSAAIAISGVAGNELSKAMKNIFK